MSLQELKALSRQIRPHHHCDLNSRPDIIAISRNLRENLARAKSKMMDSLKKSSTPKDLQIYEYLNKEDLSSSSSVPSSPNLSSSSSSSDYEDDDYSSVNSTNSSIQLRLVTNDAGSASVVPTSSFSSSLSTTTTTTTDTSTTCSSFDISDDAMIFGNPLPLYTPDFYTSPSIMNMDLFFQSPHWAKTMPCSNSDVTEDQIDSWLQRGGFGDNMSPITMATDQELADLLDFDM
ncbi:hypothetical protein EDC94DRAFT_635817 [Helicostylum pulchrum]|nr:hypothetical protein EDC94DRAFT_635817 [Helicostylum pulchrum]